LSIEAGYEVFKDYYLHKDQYRFRAITCLSDILAIGIYEAAKELKFKIPQDYSVIGYDNIISTSYLCPPLTTIHQPKIRTGIYSANILLEKIEDKSKDYQKVILEPRLVKRESAMTLT